MKGLFIPEITTEMFRNGCLESIEALMAEGEIYDIDYPLKQEPCEDCVSRQAVIDIVNNPLNIRLGEIIKKLPPVTPERPKGEWVKYSIPRCGEQHYKCSHCDEYVNFGLYGDFYTKDFIYCPHCGAKMESEGAHE